RLRNLRLSHLRVDIHPSRDGWAERFRRAAAEAATIGAGLHVAVFLGDRAEEELDALSAVVNEARPRILLWLIFREGETTSNEESIRLARKKLAGPGVHSLIAAGSSGFFADLNRNRPPEESTALPCYSVNPQVHAFDDLTMVENLSGQAATVESTGQFCRQAVVVSPVTLRPRRDANDPLESYAPGKDKGSRLPASVDPRQISLFGAGWTLGSLARLALAGNLHSVTYYETSGWRGVMETEDGSPVPGLFPSIPGAVFPMYHVFADVAGYDRIYPTHSSHPLQTEGLTLVDAKGARRVLVANFLNEPQEVRIKTGSCRANVRYLDETNAQRAMLEPEAFHQEPGETKESVSAKIELQLKPYALARVDILPG
ncbi:MAG TPA: hypothetical protein VMS21_02790, partial [Methylomirabilota bacterium]|nr:hypothetical protein [Methylomirabilota bacterium]